MEYSSPPKRLVRISSGVRDLFVDVDLAIGLCLLEVQRREVLFPRAESAAGSEFHLSGTFPLVGPSFAFMRSSVEAKKRLLQLADLRGAKNVVVVRRKYVRLPWSRRRPGREATAPWNS